jgi:tetratricopeptide (TPR) repeat protein
MVDFFKWLRRAKAPHQVDGAAATNLIKQGNAFLANGKLGEAATCYEAARAADASNADASVNLGFVLKELGQLVAARQTLEHALQLKPKSEDANYLLGLISEAEGDAGAASRYLAATVASKPDFGLAWRDWCRVLFHAGRIDEARRVAKQGLAIDPQSADLHHYLGNIHLHKNDFLPALACYEKALAIVPDFAEVHSNRGLALQELQRMDEASASFDRALALKPDFAEARWNASLCQLLMGDFARGWENYEWRWRQADHEKPRNYAQPLWLGGEDIAGKTILLYSEQGLGDTIQFCRYVERVAALGAKVILEAHTPLRTLLTGLKGVGGFADSGCPPPAFDCHCSLMSLPLAFKTDLKDISGAPYLTCPQPSIASWQEKLGERHNPRVGLVWSGRTTHKNDKNRSISFADFQEVRVPGIDYFCLQKEIRSDDRGTLSRYPEIRCFDAELNDFTDTAALIEQMDLIITVDTSVAHLAGALGKEVWILLPFIPDWRWLLGRSDSPWYDSAKFFRQPRLGDWTSVLAELKKQTHERFPG